MELAIKEPRHVRIIKACALYVLPAIIVLLLTALLFIPARKKFYSPKDIDAEIQKLEAQKASLLKR